MHRIKVYSRNVCNYYTFALKDEVYTFTLKDEVYFWLNKNIGNGIVGRCTHLNYKWRTSLKQQDAVLFKLRWS